ncbi:MAG TPA: FkbM family methyltransferase [Opitutaceae bacterium]|jgi:FkbM family methyltransferase|nr:FkbM family methyltransferase [Opitutaceae bacterium]
MITLRRNLRYINRFGLRAGLQAARLNLRPGSVVRIKLPGIEYPFWVHAGTSDVETFDEVFLTRQYELPFADFAPAHILDLGANVGYASVYFAARWPQAQILAVEPAARNIGLLERNIRPWTRITSLQAAVWPHPACVQVANPGDAHNAYRMSESMDSEMQTIPGHTVAQLIDRLGCERLDLLKMDVEGAEAEIFQNGAEWLDRVNVMMVELHDRIVPGCAQALYRALHGRRFQQEIVGGNLAIDLRS